MQCTNLITITATHYSVITLWLLCQNRCIFNQITCLSVFRECVDPLEVGVDGFRKTCTIPNGITQVRTTCNQIRSACVSTRYLITLILYVLEVIVALVVPLVFHPPNNALAIGSICPSETSIVVVQAILQFPST